MLLKSLNLKFFTYDQLYNLFLQNHPKDLLQFAQYCNKYCQSLKNKNELLKRYYEYNCQFFGPNVDEYINNKKKIEQLQASIKVKIKAIFPSYLVSKALHNPDYKDMYTNISLKQIADEVVCLVDYSLPLEEQEKMFFGLLTKELRFWS